MRSKRPFPLLTALLAVGLLAAQADSAAAQTIITVADMDLQAGELFLEGDNFGPDPEVMMGQSLGALVPLTLLAHNDNEIHSALPAGTLPGSYLVVVRAGNGAKKIAMMDVTGGAVGPAGPQGPPGASGADGVDGADGADGVPQSKTDLYQVIETSAPCGPGGHCGIEASCADANDIPLDGSCLDLGAGGIAIQIAAMLDFDDNSAPARYACAGMLPPGEETILQVQIVCISVP